MKDRCSNPNFRHYKNYGGRGITVCDRWRNFEHFYADMGPRPSSSHSIDRIDNDGPYSPENCRWATSAQQNRNRRGNRLVDVNGKTLTLQDAADAAGLTRGCVQGRLSLGWPLDVALRLRSDRRQRLWSITFRDETRTMAAWARIVGIPLFTLAQRFNAGWTVERALTEPVHPHHDSIRVTFGTETHPLPEWARRTGIPVHTLTKRLRQGWSVERALTEPIHQNKSHRRSPAA